MKASSSVSNTLKNNINPSGVAIISLVLISIVAYLYIYNNTPNKHMTNNNTTETFLNMDTNNDMYTGPHDYIQDRNDKWHNRSSPLKLPGGTTRSWSILTAGNSKAGQYDGIYDGSLTVGTMPARTREEINKVLVQVLDQVNNQTGAKYILRKMDRVNVECLRKGSVGCEQKFRSTGEYVLGARYTVDFFAHEARDQETKRFIVIFVVNLDNEVNIEHLNLANAFSHNPVFRDMGTVNIGATGKPYWKDLILTDDLLSGSNGNNQTGTNDGAGLDIAPFKADGAGWLTPRSPHEFSQKFLPRQGFQQPEMDTKIGRARYFPNRRHSKWWDPLGIFYTDAPAPPPEGANPPRYGLDHAVNRNVEIARANGLDPNAEHIRHQYQNPTITGMQSNSNTNKHHYPIFSIMDQGAGRTAAHF